MPTDFPSKGDDKKISLRNSNHPQFDFRFAKNLKENHPDIWGKGGNIRGNEAFDLWAKARDGNETESVLAWIKEREAWAARHEQDFRIAGVVANIKWGTIVSRGEKYMKNLVKEEIAKQDKSYQFDTKTVSFDLEVKENADGEFFILEGYASTFGNIDRSNDIIAKGAFQKTLMERMPKLLNQHKIDDPLGVIDRAFEDEQGLFISARMPKENSKVRDLMPLIKMGAINDFSIGFKVVDADVDAQGVRTIKEADLWEVSIVTIPANPQAKILEAKAVTPFQDFPLAPRDRNWDARNAIERVRVLSESQDAPSASYRDYFLWYDADDAENFGAYKLPYVDIIDGEPHAVVNALVAAKAAVRGARGGVDIPEGDKERVVANIDRYLERVGVGTQEESSKSDDVDDKTICVQDVEEVKDRRDFEQLLKKAGCFTNKARYALAALCKFGEEEKKEHALQSRNDEVANQLRGILDLMKR